MKSTKSVNDIRIMDKLLVEIDLYNFSAEDAVHALIHLANDLAKSSMITIGDDAQWQRFEYDNYLLKWRFDEIPTEQECNENLAIRERLSA